MRSDNQRMGFAKDGWRTGTLGVLLVLLLIQASSGRCFAQNNQGSGDSECAGDTVDRMGPDIATRSRAFLERLGKAVQADDQSQVASMLQYPIYVHIADKRFHVHNPEE